MLLTGQYSLQCDLSKPEDLEALAARVSKRFEGRLDCLCHSVAYAQADAMKRPLLETTAEAFAEAHVVSAYSLISLSRATLPLLEASEGASVLSLSYLGSTRVSVPSQSKCWRCVIVATSPPV